MTLEKDIRAALRRVSQKDREPGADEMLFSSGFLDSFALTDLLTELEKQFEISIPDDDLNPRNFASVERIEQYLKSRGL